MASYRSHTEKEEVRLKQIIDSVHGINKRSGFWNAPDTQDAWKILMGLGVDLSIPIIFRNFPLLKTIKTN